MLLRDEEKKPFKQWLLPKLESISEAEADVLADYVVALITAEGASDTVKRNCVEALGDFLRDPRPFVDEITNAIEQRTWTSGTEKPKPRPAKTAAAPTVPVTTLSNAPNPSTGGSIAEPYQPINPLNPDFRTTDRQLQPSAGALSRAASSAVQQVTPGLKNNLPDRPNGPSSSYGKVDSVAREHEAWNSRDDQPRKRKLDDWDSDELLDSKRSRYTRRNGEHPFKQTARRGGLDSRGDLTSNARRVPASYSGLRPDANPFSLPLSTMPAPPVGFPPIDPADPMAFFAAMATVFSATFPTMPSFPDSGSTTSKPTSRCKSYDLQGFCLLGSACPFTHDELTSRYDPNRASLALQPPKSTNGPSRGKRYDKIKKKIGPKNVRARATLPYTELQHDGMDQAIVVEEIPQEHLSQDSVRQFFSQYGTVLEVQMQPHECRAVVKFENHDAAKRAHDSPKVIFDNRFVKVAWSKPAEISETQTGSSRTVRIRPSDGTYAGIPDIYLEEGEDEEMIDMEEFQERQAQAQKVFEERRKKLKETTARVEDVQKQLRNKEGEVMNLKVKLIEKAKEQGVEAITLAGKSLVTSELSTLQAEAEDLFAQLDLDMLSSQGRGGFRGRARGRFFSPRGRRAYRGHHGPRSSVRRLDNRPKQLAIAGIKVGSREDEALRQYFLHCHGCEGVQPHKERPDTLVVGFSERYQAEMFLDEAGKIPDVGLLDLSWIPNSDSTIFKPKEVEPSALHRNTDDESAGTDGEELVKIKKEEEPINGGDENLDVADDADQWL